MGHGAGVVGARVGVRRCRPSCGHDDFAMNGDGPTDADRTSGVPSASRQTRTVPSPPPLTTTGQPSGKSPIVTALMGRYDPRTVSRPDCGPPPRHPHRAIDAAVAADGH